MQPLPVPPLTQTLEHFLVGVAPLLNEHELAQTKAAAANFKTNFGAVLQQRLLDLADQKTSIKESWVSEARLQTFLNDKRPLALSNSVGLQLNFCDSNQDHSQGIQRAAALIYRLVHTHLDYINGSIAQPTDHRGQPLSMHNWRVLTGALREPSHDDDRFFYAPKFATNRHVSLFWQGHHLSLQVSDDEGKLFSTTKLIQALNDIVTSDYNDLALAFTPVSALGSDKTRYYLDILLSDSHNQAVYQSLRESLFCVSLHRSGADALTQLHQQSFMPGSAWLYKPFNYQIDLDSDYLGMQLEHGDIDGGALKRILTYAFALDEDTGIEGIEAKSENLPTVERLDWHCDAATASLIEQDVALITKLARQIQIRKFNVDYSAITVKVSHDAIMQCSLAYAQLKVFGQVRNTYQAVDVSHFMAGRTEGLRPNSAEAIELCQALLDGSATTDILKAQLDSAFAEHKRRVIASKMGQAFDRHFTGLSLMVKEGDDQHYDQTFFQSPGYRLLTEGDFLSTSSMGDRSLMICAAFVPTFAGGFGVYYSSDAQAFEFCLMADQDSSAYLEAMQEAITEGVHKLIALIEKGQYQ